MEEQIKILNEKVDKLQVTLDWMIEHMILRSSADELRAFDKEHPNAFLVDNLIGFNGKPFS